MLVEFRMKNFRSFRDETALKVIASSDKSTQTDNVFVTGNKSVSRLLRSMAIYGANASGKSNLVRGMQVMRAIVDTSASLQVGQELNVQPFRLDPEVSGTPTEFEITFLLENVRYQFGFTLTTKRIVSEWLIVYKTTQPSTWYERRFVAEKGQDEYTFSSQLLGTKVIWGENTGENTLFLSRAVQMNSEQLRPIFNFVARGLVIFENGAIPIPNYTVSHIANNSPTGVKKFLSAADISINDITLQKEKAFSRGVTMDLATGKMEAVPMEEQELHSPLFHHKTRAGSAIFNFNDESEGTQRLFALAGPLFEILQRGQVLVVDELHRGLHELLVRQLIMMFHDKETNRKGAQLIFTTHDTSLLDGDLLRRDQIWFTEKDEDQASRLYPLTDFSPRKGEAREKGYLSGRYGAIPLLRPMTVS
jgi:AAA15 family ATPase/GTPase